MAIAQGAAQGADLDLQVRVFDKGFRPGSGYQFFLADNLAGAFEQRRKDVKGTAAEAHRLVAFKQQALCREKPERAKDDGLSVHRLIAEFTPFYLFLLDWRHPQTASAVGLSLQKALTFITAIAVADEFASVPAHAGYAHHLGDRRVRYSGRGQTTNLRGSSASACSAPWSAE